METKRPHVAKTFMWGKQPRQKYPSAQLQLHCRATVKATKLPVKQTTRTHGTQMETKVVNQWRKIEEPETDPPFCRHLILHKVTYWR